MTTGNYNRVFNVTVMGSNSNETTILTDGVSINNVRSGGSWLLTDFDGAAEVSTTTLGASAEYQAAGGGVMNVVGKTGTNDFHGDASGFWSPDALTSKPRKLPCATCEDGESGFTWYKYRDLSAHIGGPINRDNLWFFTGLIYRARFGTSPGQAPPPPEEQFLDMITDTNTKMTWKINDKLTFQQTYYAELWGTVNPNIVSPTRPIATLQHSQAGIKDDPNLGSQLTAILSPSTVLTARYGLTMGASRRIGFFRDLTTPNRTDDSSGVQSGNTNAHRFWPRRDEVSAKVNTYLSGDRLSHNLSYGLQISRNKDVFVQIEPGGVLYNDLSSAPNLATFVGPDARGAISRAQGYWAEDEMTMGRVTVKVGGRFDRMVGISQDVPQFDGEFNEIGTLTGLGEMVKWNTFSPRVGSNVRLTGDGKTVLRGVAGRYYLPLFLGEFEDLHPGRAVRDLYRYNAATGGYTTFVSRTDPRTQFRIDPDMKAPVHRSVLARSGSGARQEPGRRRQLRSQERRQPARLGGYRRRLWHQHRGDQRPEHHPVPAAQCPERSIVSANERTRLLQQLHGGHPDRDAAPREPVAVHRRLHPPEGPGARAGKCRRGAWRKSERNARGTRPERPDQSGGASGCTGPAEHGLADGRVRDSEDRCPAVGEPDRRVGNSDLLTGERGLPQGTRTINLESPGSQFRTPVEKFMHVRFTKIMFRNGPRRVELTGEVKNALNEMGTPSIRSQIWNNANFLVTNTFPEPRQLRFFARVFF